MTAIILIIAALSLSAGFYLLITGRRAPESGTPAQHKVNIRKAAEPAPRKVDDSPPEGLSDNRPELGKNDCDVDQTDEPATDEDASPDLVLTGE